MNQWPPSNNGQVHNSTGLPNGSSTGALNVQENSPPALQAPPASASGRKTPVFSVPTSAASEASPQESAPNGPLYASYYPNNNGSQVNEPKPHTTPNGTSNGNMQAYTSPSGQTSFSQNSQGASNSMSNGEEYSTLHHAVSQAQAPATASPAISTTSNGYSHKGSSDLATLLKSNGPYPPTPVNGISSPHSTASDSLLSSSTTNSNSNDHFLVNTTTTVPHLSNLTTSMNTSTGK